MSEITEGFKVPDEPTAGEKPAKTWRDHGREWLDTLVVAISVAMAFRAYFFEPFNIPTGSMQPTLFGNHSEPCAKPGVWQETPLKWLNWLVTGRDYKEFKTPSRGCLAVVNRQDGRCDLYFHPISSRGSVERELSAFEANPGKPVLTVPQDVLNPASPCPLQLRPLVGADQEIGFIPAFLGSPFAYAMTRGVDAEGAGVPSLLVLPAQHKLWQGYDTSGDFIFVNRMKWNFRQPARGDVMVFATNGIGEDPNGHYPGHDGSKHYSLQQGTHYIKRLTALPGEELEIVNPVRAADGTLAKAGQVLINGTDVTPIKPMTGTLGNSFEKDERYEVASPEPNTGLNSRMTGPVKLGRREYFACGDNADNSLDSRYWGSVPEKNLKGTGSFVFWPIINPRWGFIK